jgi:anti-sigma B factor antagonist
MQIVERDVDDVTILQLHGRMVMDEGDVPLRQDIQALAKDGRVKIVIDMADVSRLDSAGIGSLVSSYLTVHRHGGDIKLLHLTDRASQLLRLTKLAEVFEIYDSEEAALASFGPASERH